MGRSQRQTVAASLRRWHDAGQPAALATVTASTSSAPRGIGAQLAVAADGTWTGAISGGCAEVSVLDAAARLLDGLAAGAVSVADGVQVRITRDELGSEGPVCGATLTIVVELVDDELLCALEASARSLRRSTLERTWIPRDDASVSDEQTALTRLAVTQHDNHAPWTPGVDKPFRIVITPPTWTFTELLRAPEMLAICGGGDVAAALIRGARELGWVTALVDPRPGFVARTVSDATPDHVIDAWPEAAWRDERMSGVTACVATSHEARIDEPFLTAALHQEIPYIASVGSRIVQAARRSALIEAMGPARMTRVVHHRGPAGLDLGGSDASEIALSILAEVLAVSNSRTGMPLHSSAGAIRAT